MSEQLRPSVTITEQVQALVNSGININTITIIGVTEKGPANVFQTFTNIADIEAVYGTNTNRGATAVELARYAFRNGAGRIRMCSIGNPTVAQTATTLSAPALAGATSVTLTAVTGITNGDTIFIGPNIAGFKFEENRVVTSVVGSVVSFTEPLQFDHVSGETVVEITPKILSDYQTAFNELENDRDTQLVVCDSDVEAILSGLETALDNAIAKSNKMYMFRSVARGVSESTARTTASTLDQQYATLLFPVLTGEEGRYLTGAHTAAGVAGAIVGRGIPTPNMNLLPLTGYTGVENSIADYDACINSGVSPIEISNGVIRVSRLMTTSQTVGGNSSDLLEEASVRLNVNELERVVQARLEAAYLTAGNTRATRNLIRLDVLEVLRTWNDNGIFAEDELTGTPGYTEPTVSVDPNNRKRILVSATIAPTQPLVFINFNVAINL